MTEAADRFSKVLAVVDPTRLVQPALIKAEWIARKDEAALHVYCCVYDEESAENEEQQALELTETRAWLERLIASSEAPDLEVTVQVEWKRDWREALVAAAIESESSLVVKTASRHSAIGRRLMKTSDWVLLQHCPCPTLLVSGSQLWSNKTLLAAIKLRPEDDVHERLNARIVDVSHNISRSTGFELYAVTAYKGNEVFFDRQSFADTCRLPRSRVRSVEGPAQKGIAEIAEEIGADVIVVGNPGGAGAKETARRLIDQVNADVFVLPHWETPL